MIKTIILLVIVFYTFPCRKINAQSRDTSNIFAGYYIAVYNKSDLSHKKIRRHHKHSYNTAIDSRYRTYFIPIKIGKNNINQENIWKEVTDNKTESDTIFIFPDSTDIKLFKQIGLIDSNISDKKHLLLQEIKSLPYYNTASNKAYLFKCLYVKGTFLQLRIDTIDKNWQDYLLDIYSISTKKKKKLLLVTGIDSLHSIKSDGTSIQARPYIKTGQQKPCTALIVGNWFAGEEGYIRKEALLEQGEPFVSWIRCNDCPQIRFNESNSGSVVYPGPPVSWNDPSNPDDPQAGYGYIPNDTTKEETFFYHSDHLGSTSYITDDKANITQYDAYLPYGELLVDEHSSSEELPYKFNGKQFDEETGLYYYGARYMNPMTSLWYGVDPEIEKVPGCSPFTYTFSNPITLIDPNGQSAKVTVNAHSKTIVVSATLVFYGECASAAIAAQTAADIQNGWNEAHGTVKLGNTTYNVIFKIKGEYRDVSGWLGLKRAELKLEMAKNTDPEINYIEVVKYATKGSIPGISNFDIGGNRGEFQYNNIQGSGTTTEAHEFGHGLGLKHPDRDLRKKGQPGIMAPRNTLVDPKYQYNPKAKPDSRNGGTLNPAKRKVTQEDIDNLKINKLHFKDGKAYLGHAT